MSDELKPCPFCGATNLKIEDFMIGVYVVCDKCHATGPEELSESGAAERWNERKEAETCEWTKLVGGMFTTKCSKLGVFRSGEFCPSCGKRIVVVKDAED